MALCDTCYFMTKEHDEFRQTYNDTIIENGDKREKHYCPMYSDNIPNRIFYENAMCDYYWRK